MFISRDSYIKMKLLKYDTGEAVTGDPKSAFIERAKTITGRPMDKFSEMNLGLDFSRLGDMSDEEIGQLFNLMQSLAPEQKGDTEGAISNIKGSFGDIKSALQGLTENYGVDVEDILDGIIEHGNMGWLKGKSIKAAAKVAGLYSGGGVIKLRR